MRRNSKDNGRENKLNFYMIFTHNLPRMMAKRTLFMPPRHVHDEEKVKRKFFLFKVNSKLAL
jgi:hypothetical protein